jgi:hypothetical protein
MVWGMMRMRPAILSVFAILILSLPVLAEDAPSAPEKPDGETSAETEKDPVKEVAAPEKAAEVNAEPEETRVLVMNLQNAGAEENDVKIITNLVATSFARDKRLNVLTSSDLAQAMDLEAQKHAMDCDQGTCLAEIAGALGARYVVHGNAGRLGGTTFILHLSVYDSTQAKNASRKDIRGVSMEALPSRIDEVVLEMIGEFGLAGESNIHADHDHEKPVTSESLMTSPMFIGGGVAAVIGIGAAAVFGWMASTQNARLDDPNEINKDQALVQGRTLLGVMAVMGLVGVTGAGFAAWGSVR